VKGTGGFYARTATTDRFERRGAEVESTPKMRNATMKIGRNDPCPCGSGRKYKHCCFAKDQARGVGARAEEVAVRDALERAAQAQQAGRLGEAAFAYAQVLALRPELAAAHYNLGNVLQAQGRMAEAIESFRRSLELQPGSVEAYCNLGSALKSLARHEEAIAEYRKALALQPDAALVHFNLGNALRDTGDFNGAIESYRRAIEHDPALEEAYPHFWSLLEEAGRSQEIIAAYRQALSVRPDNAMAYDSMLFLLAYQCLAPTAEYLALARGWEAAMVPAADRQAAREKRFVRAPLAGRRLRLGYVSGDFRRHAVSQFIEPVLACHDRSCVELFAYATAAVRDDTTAHIEAQVDHWRAVDALSDSELRDRIEADGVDVLIDLSGHTGYSRLGAFARRAAPVQAHYLGYFASTGLTEMDYWIGDEILTPAPDDGQFSETLWRLPRTWVSYQGRPEAPEPARRVDADGGVRLGSFNDLKKFTPATAALWSKVLLALPEGRLVMKTRSLSDRSNRERVLGEFAAHGIPVQRLELQDTSLTPDWGAHMAHYNRLDIALDPVGAVGGGTTTCDALWMGVPVVGLVGDRAASRMTSSMLHAIGRPEWLAQTEDQYVAIAVALARDAALRDALRATQRARMAASPLCDARALTASLEDAYVSMFERWLAGAGRRSGAGQ
jgi:predicted O-linked N-acetylglucosamine transferase (SPINDLY family)